MFLFRKEGETHNSRRGPLDALTECRQKAKAPLLGACVGSFAESISHIHVAYCLPCPSDAEAFGAKEKTVGRVVRSRRRGAQSSSSWLLQKADARRYARRETDGSEKARQLRQVSTTRIETN